MVVICDGMADSTADFQDGMTPMARAQIPNMDFLARMGRSGCLHTIPTGKYVGSETAILTILGYKPEELPSGRGPLEATGLGLDISSETYAARYILSETIDLECILHDYPSCRFHALSDRTGISLFQDDCRERLHADPRLKIWSEDKKRSFRDFRNPNNKDISQWTSAALIGKVPLVKGIAMECGLKWIEPDGATGDIDTDYQNKGTAMIGAIKNHDIVIVHIEACDAASHRRDLKSKIKAIESIDSNIISLLRKLYSREEDISVAVISDHPTLCSSGTHSREATPALICFKGIKTDSVLFFSEKEAKNGSLKEISELWETAE